jgi:NAD(P)-dependent dehydrogenase (short-subunit alcohol dehydrogenase family)
MGEFRERIFVVTGANSGVGKSTTRSLATRGARLVMVCRSRGRGEIALEEIRRQTGNDRLQLRVTDLAELDQVRRLGDALADELDHLDGLVNNAGVLRARREITVDGFERTMATNHLAHFLLTALLLDRLKAAGGRVVNVSSQAHRSGKLGRAPLEAICKGEIRYRSLQAYNDSKLANVLFSNELARRTAGKITSNALHPGVLATRIWNQNKTPASLVAAAFKPLMGSPDVGGRATARLAADAQLASVSGRYFDGERPVEPAPDALDRDLARRLWQTSEDLTGMAY